MAPVASETSTARSLNPGFTHDVYLSFTDETPDNFGDFLYKRLKNAGLVVYRDKEITRGENVKEELEKPIKESRISVIVFSKGYASSKWCLDEVVAILECSRICGHQVLPVFFEIERSEVRYQTGSFAKAFEKYEQEISRETDNEKKHQQMDKLVRWRASLNEVADLSGFRLLDWDRKIIEGLVDHISRRLYRTAVSIPPKLIGVDQDVEKISQWLCYAPADAILVISGMSGVGKTTVAKCAYNLNFERFERSSFLSDITTSIGQKSGLYDLHSQLLSDILMTKQKVDTHSVYEAVNRIADAMYGRKVLLVFDDVSAMSELSPLLPSGCLHSGSKVIITTRNKQLMNPSPAIFVHTMETLNYDNSLELLCWKAFGDSKPPNSFTEISTDLVRYCGGLPLALCVFSSMLFRKSLDIWRRVLLKSEVYLDHQLLTILRKSYDSLSDDHDRNLFLDIACFFVGEDIDVSLKILDSYGFSAKRGVKNLMDNCLLKISKDNKVIMHQLLQKMGREIVRRESHVGHRKHSRLWCHEDSVDILNEKTVTDEIIGLVLGIHMTEVDNLPKPSTDIDNPEKQLRRVLGGEQSNLVTLAPSSSKANTNLVFDMDVFARLRGLKILHLNYVQLKGSYKKFPDTLRWLRWHGFYLKSIPRELEMSSMVALDMSYSKLRQTWDGRKFLPSLAFLNLSHSEELVRTPDFSGIPNLEILILEGCIRLVEVSHSIELLRRLTSIDLRNCQSLMNLPTSICNLKNLETLKISGCPKLHVPTELKERKKEGKISSFLISRGLTLTDFVEDMMSVSKEPIADSSSKAVPRNIKPTEGDAVKHFKKEDKKSSDKALGMAVPRNIMPTEGVSVKYFRKDMEKMSDTELGFHRKEHMASKSASEPISKWTPHSLAFYRKELIPKKSASDLIAIDKRGDKSVILSHAVPDMAVPRNTKLTRGVPVEYYQKEEEKKSDTELDFHRKEHLAGKSSLDLITKCKSLDFYRNELIPKKSASDPVAIDKWGNRSLILSHDVPANNSFLTATGDISVMPSVHSELLKPRKYPEIMWTSFSSFLMSLNLTNCNLADDSFPSNFNTLSLLRNMNLSKNRILSLPDCIRSLHRLNTLWLDSCPLLQSIVNLQTTVENLIVRNCASLENISYESTKLRSQSVIHTGCKKLAEIQGWYKFKPIGKSDKDRINNLGLNNLTLLRNVKVLYRDGIAAYTKKHSIKGLYEFGMFSTFVPATEFPGCLYSHKGVSSVSFIVPPNVQSFNVLSVYKLSKVTEVWHPHPIFTKVQNITKDISWVYGPTCFGIPEGVEELMWLSNWKFGNLLEAGDEVTVSVVMGDGFLVNECLVQLSEIPVYEEAYKENGSEHNCSSYLCWEEVIGGDLSSFQLSRGVYFLCHHGFLRLYQGRLWMDDWTTTRWFESLFGEAIDLAEVERWNWLGG